MSRIRTLLLTLAMAAPVALGAQAPAAKPGKLPADSMEIGRKYVQWLYDNRGDSLFAHMTAENKASPNMRTELENISATLVTRVGSETKVISDRYITRNGMRQFWHTADASLMTEPVVIRIVITEKGEIAGFGMNPLSHVPAVDP